MEPDELERAVRTAERAERGFVRLLGGYTVGLAGGTLLVNERLPAPRFNVVQIVAVARGRQAQFFEAALDHYFQRALRPEFRVAEPVPGPVDETLQRLRFRRRPGPEVWLVAGPGRPTPRAPPAIRRVPADELEQAVSLWADGREFVELRRQIEVGMNHPNPGEELVPFVANGRNGRVASAGLAYRRGNCLDIEAVTTVPPERGRGSATDLVAGILGDPWGADARYVALRSAEPRLEHRLSPLGFELAARSAIYALDPAAELRVPIGPSPGPLWRPPRG